MSLLESEAMGSKSNAEILDALLALHESGACDTHTLKLVARALGVRRSFDQQSQALTGWVAVERPALMLNEGKR